MAVPKKTNKYPMYKQRKVLSDIKKLKCQKQFPECPDEPNENECKTCPFYNKQNNNKNCLFTHSYRQGGAMKPNRSERYYYDEKDNIKFEDFI